MSDPPQLTARVMGALIGAALKEDGMSQVDFACLVGVSAKHLNQVIRGAAVSRLLELDYWAFALGRSWSVTLDKRQ